MSLFDVIRAGKVDLWELDFGGFPESVMDKWKYRLLMYQWDNLNRLVNADPESKGAELAQYVVDTFNLYIDNAIQKIEFENKIADNWGEWADKINMSDELILDQANCAVFLSVMINEHMDVPDVLYYALRYKDSVDGLEKDATVAESRLEKMYENWFMEELLNYEEDEDTMVRIGELDIDEPHPLTPECVLTTWQNRISAQHWDNAMSMLRKLPDSKTTQLAWRVIDATQLFLECDIDYIEYSDNIVNIWEKSNTIGGKSPEEILMLGQIIGASHVSVGMALEDIPYMLQYAMHFKDNIAQLTEETPITMDRSRDLYEKWFVEELMNQ